MGEPAATKKKVTYVTIPKETREEQDLRGINEIDEQRKKEGFLFIDQKRRLGCRRHKDEGEPIVVCIVRRTKTDAEHNPATLFHICPACQKCEDGIPVSEGPGRYVCADHPKVSSLARLQASLTRNSKQKTKTGKWFPTNLNTEIVLAGEGVQSLPSEDPHIQAASALPAGFVVPAATDNNNKKRKAVEQLAEPPSKCTVSDMKLVTDTVLDIQRKVDKIARSLEQAQEPPAIPASEVPAATLDIDD